MLAIGLVGGLVATSFVLALTPRTALAASAAPGSAGVPVIIDTDNYSNTDDAGAMAEAFALDLQGTVNVLAIGMDTRTSRPAVATNSWKCVAAIEQFYGFGDVPIGSDMPDNGTTVNSPDIVGPCAALASPSTPAPQPVVSVYRRALASAANDSVQIVGIGYDETLEALLQSPPDAISPLSGSALVALKVKSLILTGGGFPSNTGENNFVGNPAAAEYVAANWPTKVVYSGFEVGNVVFTGHTLSTVQPANSPVRVDYQDLVGAGKNNRSWDLTTLYHAVFPADPLLSEVGPGTDVVNGTGGNVFTPGAGDQYYLSLGNATTLASELEPYFKVLPGTTPQAVAFTSTPPPSPSVGGTYTATATGGASGNPVTFSIDPSSTSSCTVDPASGLVSFGATDGTCVVDGYQDATVTYAAGSAQQTMTVGPASQPSPQTITFSSTPPASPVVGDTYAVTATGGASGNPVILSIDSSSTSGCTIATLTGVVTFGGPAGTCVVDANQAGNASYLAAPQVQQPITVGLAPQAIAFTTTAPLSPQVGGSYAAAVTPGASGDPVTYSVDASSTAGCTVATTGVVTFAAPVGTCVIDANEAGNASYLAAPQVQQSMTVGQGTQVISVTSTPPSSMVIGGTYAIAATGGASGNPLTFAIDASSTSGCIVDSTGLVTFDAPSGTCVIDLNQAGNTNYLAAAQVQQTVGAATSTQSISFTSTPPSNATVGGNYVVSATGGASGNPVTFSIDATSTSGCTLGTSTNVVTFSGAAGSCVIDANQAGSGQYLAAPQAQQTVTVAKAPQAITFSSTPPVGATVGGTYMAVASGGGSGNPVTYTADAASTSGCTVVAATGLVTFAGPAGSCVIDANQAGNAGYLAAPQAQQQVTVGLAPQVITFTSTPPSTPEINDSYTVTATGGPSGNPVTLSVDKSSTSGCTINGTTGVVVLSGPAGTCVIDANQAGNTSYLAAAQVQQATAPIRIPVIIDSDLYSNSDDAGAMASAFALDLQGTVNVLAINLDTRTSRPAVATNTWKCAAAIEQFYGFGNVPIGSDMPDNGTTVNSPDMVGPCAALASSSTVPPASAVSVYRRALAAAPNDSVRIVGTGYEENLEALLKSPPDAISPLSGSALVALKVRSLTLTGGGYPSHTTENNFAGNPAAAAYVAANWPGKVVYSGYEVGYQVFTGHTLSTVQPASSPVRVAYQALVGAGKNNRSYDLTTLFHAVFPANPLLGEIGPGTNAINSSGSNVFTAGTGDAYYLSLQSATSLASVLEAYFKVLPGTTPQNVTFTSTPPASPGAGTTYAAAATGGASGNPVTFSIDPTSTSSCTVDPASGLVTFGGGAGTCVVDAYQDATLTYAAGHAKQTISIGKAAQTITFTSPPPTLPKVGGTYVPKATATSNLTVTITVAASAASVCSISAGTVSFHSIGVCLLDANQAGNASYLPATQVQQSMTVGQGTQTITFTSTPPATRTVGGTYSATAASTSKLSVTLTIDSTTTGTCSISAGVVTFKAKGTCTIDANQTGNANYLAAAQVQQTFTIA